MKTNWRKVLCILLVFVVIGLFVIRLASRGTLPPDHSRVLFTCNGSPEERKFLVSQDGSVVSNGIRHCIPPDGFVTYKFIIGESELERAYWGINHVGFRLEFSIDGNDWSSLVNLPNRSSKKLKSFSNHSCGFSIECKKSAAQSGTAYFRYSTKETEPKFYVGVKYFSLQVSGSTIPRYFHRPSVLRNTAAYLMRMLAPKLMILVGFGAVIICHRLWKTRWRLFGAGALLWLVSVVAKFAFAFFGLKPVDKVVHDVLPPLAANLAYWSYIGLLTGIFECGIFLLFIKYIRRRKWNWKDATSLGVGFGAIEAIATGIAAAATSGILYGGVISLGGDVDFASSFIGPVERLIALAVHAASVTMILYALTQHKWMWFVASFLYKSGIDGVAAFIALSASKWSNTHPWIVEFLLFGPFAYVGFCVLLILRNEWWRGDTSTGAQF